jgi:leader peptidase (prepilin peptidase)/N-methyltransferase
LEIVFELIPVAYLLAVSGPLIITDIREHRLPNKLVLPAIPVALVSWLVLAITLNQWGKFFIALLCGLGVFALGVLANRFGRIGMGDVKLSFSLVLVVGWFSWPLALLVPVLALVFILATVAFIIFVRKNPTPQSIAFGPHLIIAFAFLLGVALVI